MNYLYLKQSKNIKNVLLLKEVKMFVCLRQRKGTSVIPPSCPDLSDSFKCCCSQAACAEWQRLTPCRGIGNPQQSPVLCTGWWQLNVGICEGWQELQKPNQQAVLTDFQILPLPRDCKIWEVLWGGESFHSRFSNLHCLQVVLLQNQDKNNNLGLKVK